MNEIEIVKYPSRVTRVTSAIEKCESRESASRRRYPSCNHAPRRLTRDCAPRVRPRHPHPSHHPRHSLSRELYVALPPTPVSESRANRTCVVSPPIRVIRYCTICGYIGEKVQRMARIRTKVYLLGAAV